MPRARGRGRRPDRPGPSDPGGSLPAGARVGTSSLRRRAQFLYLRPDLEVVTLRGNVETRLNQALEGKLDAVVLAWAGLHRLGLEQHVTQRLEPPVPARGGAGGPGDRVPPRRRGRPGALAAARRPGHPSSRPGRAPDLWPSSKAAA